MGFIRNNDEEKEQYNLLIKQLKSMINYRNEKNINALIKYVDNVKNGKIDNAFVDFDIMKSAVLNMARNDGAGEYMWDGLKSEVSVIFPMGTETPNFDILKKQYIGCKDMSEDVDWVSTFFNPTFFMLFKDSSDYFRIINAIRKSKVNYNDVVNFAINIAKEIEDNDLLNKELCAYINNYSSIVDKKSYLEERTKQYRMRYGIYPGVTEENIARVARDLEKTRTMVDDLDKKYSSFINRVTKTLDDYTREVDSTSKKAITEVSSKIKTLEIDHEKKLDSHLSNLKTNMEIQTDAACSEVIELAKSQLEEIKTQMTNISAQATKSSLALKDELIKAKESLEEFSKTNGEALERIKVVVPETKVVETPSIEMPATIIATDYDTYLRADYTMTEGLLPVFDPRVAIKDRLKLALTNLKTIEKTEGLIVPSNIEEALKMYISGNKALYLYGPTQSGKTTFASLLAKACGTDLIDGGKITEEHSVTSYNDVRGKFNENQLFSGLYYGKTVLFDEFDNGNPNNIVLLGTYISSLKKKIKHPEQDVRVLFANTREVPINPNARIITAGNTSGSGANREYSARSKFDESTNERLAPLFVGYDERVEQKILGKYKNWYSFFKKFREFCEDYAAEAGSQPIGSVTTDDASTIKDEIENGAMTVSELIRFIFTQTKNSAYLAELSDMIQEEYDVSVKDNLSLYQDIPLKELSTKQIAETFVSEASKVKRY